MLTACETHRPDPLPTVEWQSVEDARQILIDRQAAIESVQTQLKFRITPPPENGSDKSGGGGGSGGKTHTLDAALVIRGDDHLRLRAWKLGQTVFDLTANPDGTFIVADEEMTDRAPDAPDAERNLAELADQLGAMLRGPDWAEARIDRMNGSSGTLLEARWDNGSSEIDARTLAPLRFVFSDPSAEQHVQLETRYTAYDRGYWLHAVEATGPFGKIELNFYDVELNGELNPRAFTPPRRAKKIEVDTSAQTGSDPVSFADPVSLSPAGESP